MLLDYYISIEKRHFSQDNSDRTWTEGICRWLGLEYILRVLLSNKVIPNWIQPPESDGQTA